jgi:hypothetical protein
LIDGNSTFLPRGHTLPPPAQYVIERACDNLWARGVIAKKNIKFIHALEFATPLDDVSQLFRLPEGKKGWEQKLK